MMNRKLTILIAIIAIIFAIPLCAGAKENLYTASPDGEISLRIAPDEKSYEITKVPACSKVELLETENTWGKVLFENKCGWINLSFTVKSYNESAEVSGTDLGKNVKVDAKSGSTKLYNVPTSDEKLGSTVVATVPNSTILSVKRETSSGWGLVSMNKKYAWVKMSDTEKYGSYAEDNIDEYGIFYVYISTLNGNGATLWRNKGSIVLATIPDCVKLTVREESGNYGYVSYNGLNGWIDLGLTADSYSNALANTGKAVNEEYKIINEEEINMMSVPSYNEETGTYAVEKLENEEAVFILRQTNSGWSLLSKNGVRGWIPTQYLGEATDGETEMPQMCEPYDVYILTKKLQGVKLYPAPNSDEDSICTIPECAKMMVIAKSGESLYLQNDYASGWTNVKEFASTLDEAIESHSLENRAYYIIKDETTLRTLPIYAELCGSEELLTVPVGKEFTVTKIVTTGDRKWGLTEIDGKQGWINLNCANKSISLSLKVIILLAMVVIIAMAIIIYRKIRRNKNGKQL